MNAKENDPGSEPKDDQNDGQESPQESDKKSERPKNGSAYESKPGALAEFLERPALLIGESEKAYEDLLDEVYDLLDPKDLFDRLRATDIANSIWESRRLRMLSADFVTNARVDALALLLGPFLAHDHNAAIACAQACYGNEKKSKLEALEVVRRFKITDAQVNAQAYLMHNLPITIIDRGVTNRENLRRSLVKEHARKLKKAEKAHRRQKQTPFGDTSGMSTMSTLETSAKTSDQAGVNDNATAGAPATMDLPKRNLKRRGEV